MSTKRYKSWSPEQPYLVPPSPRDWLPEGHLAFFISELVAELDLSKIEDAYQARDPRGERPFHPQMMVSLLLYAYCTGTYSSRRIALATYEDVAMRYLSGGNHPHFTTVALFRRKHLEALGGLFVQALRMCAEAGLVSLGHVSLDGTKIKANASKHRAMSYERMAQEEHKLTDEIAALLARAESTDAHEDASLGDDDGLGIPQELRRREDRLQVIRAAKARLEEAARRARAAALRDQQASHEEIAAAEPDTKRGRTAATNARKRAAAAEALESELDDDGHDDDPPDDPRAPTLPMPRHQPRVTPEGAPKPSAQGNFTDPDSRIMVDGQGAFVQAYNAQAAVDADHQVIVATGLSNQAPDTEYLQPVLARIEATMGARPDVVTADTGYWSADNAAWCAARSMDAFIAVGRVPHGPTPPAVEHVGPEPPHEPPREAMRRKLHTERGQQMYRLRKTIPEPVFGQIKEARAFRRFLLRGIDNVQKEWDLICAAHNVLKLFRWAGPVFKPSPTPA